MMVRWWHFALALTVSVGLHGAADYALRDNEPAIREQGASNAQISMLGSADFSALLSGDETTTSEPVKTPMALVAAAHKVAVEKPVKPVPARKYQAPAMAAAVTSVDHKSALLAVAPVDVTKGNAAVVSDVAVAEATVNETRHKPVQSEAERKPVFENVQTAAIKPTSAQEVKTQQNTNHDVLDAAVVRPLEANKAARPITVPTPGPPTPVRLVKLDKTEPVRTGVLIKPELNKKKKPKKKKTSQKGNKGKNKRSSKKGRADGAASGDAKSAGKSKKSEKKGVSGNADTSNYPGKVRRKLHRALRYPKKARSAKLRGTTHVRFSVGPSGRVGVAGIARSSGSAVLDAAALATVRRAAPFPKIPRSSGRKSWSFTVPLEFAPRSR